MATHPEIQFAAGHTGMPVASMGWSPFTLPGSSQAGVVWVVTPGYFRTYGIPLIAGRTFREAETANDAPVAMVSRDAARRGWPNGDALGKMIQAPGDRPREIVGVVGDVRATVRTTATPTLYRPFGPAAGPSSMVIAVRSRASSEAIAAIWKTEVQRQDPRVIATATPFASVIASQVAVSRFQTILFAVFGALGLALAALGIFGVVRYVVMRRTHEIGVRMALGADRRAVRAMVVRQALAPVIAGLVAGLVAAFWLTRLLEASLFEMTPHDPATFAAVAALLLLIALAAIDFPARRATRVDPIEALRVE
jgi:hypothetical protein